MKKGMNDYIDEMFKNVDKVNVETLLDYFERNFTYAKNCIFQIEGHKQFPRGDEVILKDGTKYKDWIEETKEMLKKHKEICKLVSNKLMEKANLLNFEE